MDNSKKKQIFGACLTNVPRGTSKFKNMVYKIMRRNFNGTEHECCLAGWGINHAIKVLRSIAEQEKDILSATITYLNDLTCIVTYNLNKKKVINNILYVKPIKI